MNRSRLAFAGFPEVKQVVSQTGRSDDGTDATGFFNTEYFIDLKPRSQWRRGFHWNKEELIEALDREVEKIPGVAWGFSQPIADNMEEAVSGVKGELAVKIFGTDLNQLEQKGEEIMAVMRGVRGIEDLGLFRVLGQPNINLVVDRTKTDRFGINVADVQDAIETAVGGKAVSQVLEGEERFDLVVRYQEPFRRTIDDIANIRILAPSGERVSLGELCDIKVEDGASMVYREGNSRYIAIKYSVRARDLGSTVEEAIRRVNAKVQLPRGYSMDWAGEYESQQRANERLAVMIPITVLVILLLLHTAFGTFKWAFLVLVNLAVAPIGGLLALLLTGTHLSVSSGIGLLALFGVSVQIGLIMVQYINQLRARGLSAREAAIQAATRTLRPVIMVMLVATLGLLPAALSHDIGSDSQRPFAIVIVGGLMTDLLISVFLLPTVYAWVARPNDRLPAPEQAVVST
jgi:cobalt-zinc-cadmium resistance protein CzcA